MTHVAKTRATLSSPPPLPPTCMAPGQVDEAESPPPITSFGAVRLLELGFNAAFGLAPAEESGSDATKLSVGERGRERPRPGEPTDGEPRVKEPGLRLARLRLPTFGDAR